MLIIRPAKPEEGAIVARVRVASWRHAYRGIVPDTFLETMDANEAQWNKAAAGKEPGVQLLVCEVDGQIAGFACFGTARPPNHGYSGELYATYFLPEMIGKGFGAATMSAAIEGLRALGHGDMLLWVIENNSRARRFYESFGGSEISNSRQTFSLDGCALWEVAYGFRPLPARAAKR